MVRGQTPGQGTYAGDFANDGRFPGYQSSWAKYWPDRANTFWGSPDNFIWDGTDAQEGNTGQVNYEWPMSQSGGHNFSDFSETEYFCATVSGNC